MSVRRRATLLVASGLAVLAMAFVPMSASYVTSALGPAAAHAQIDPPIPDYLGAVNAWATAESLRRMLPDSRRAGQQSRTAPERRSRMPRPTKRQLAALRFTRDPLVTQRNHQAIVARLGSGVDPAVVVSDIERNRALAHEAMRSLGRGWSPDDLADVAAFALLSGYAAYHGVSKLSGAGSRAVRRSARSGLASSRRVRRIPDADKQTGAEMTEIRMFSLLAALSEARAAGDTADVSIGRSEIRIWIREVYGLDVDAVRLTRRGFA